MGMPLSGLIRVILASEDELGHVSLLYFRPGGYLVECPGCAHKGALLWETLLVTTLVSA